MPIHRYKKGACGRVRLWASNICGNERKRTQSLNVFDGLFQLGIWKDEIRTAMFPLCDCCNFNVVDVATKRKPQTGYAYFTCSTVSYMTTVTWPSLPGLQSQLPIFTSSATAIKGFRQWKCVYCPKPTHHWTATVVDRGFDYSITELILDSELVVKRCSWPKLDHRVLCLLSMYLLQKISTDWRDIILCRSKFLSWGN